MPVAPAGRLAAPGAPGPASATGAVEPRGADSDRLDRCIGRCAPWLGNSCPLSPADVFAGYTRRRVFDEMLDGTAQPRRAYRRLHNELLKLTPEELRRSKQQADLTFFNQGITFTVYGRNEGTERIFPHDLLPRIISAADWEVIERGLTQRITALNLFLKDLYHEQQILHDGVVPRQRDLHLPPLPPSDERRARCRATPTST